jgi:hypothetical protein
MHYNPAGRRKRDTDHPDEIRKRAEQRKKEEQREAAKRAREEKKAAKERDAQAKRIAANMMDPHLERFLRERDIVATSLFLGEPEADIRRSQYRGLTHPNDLRHVASEYKGRLDNIAKAPSSSAARTEKHIAQAQLAPYYAQAERMLAARGMVRPTVKAKAAPKAKGKAKAKGQPAPPSVSSSSSSSSTPSVVRRVLNIIQNA